MCGDHRCSGDLRGARRRPAPRLARSATMIETRSAAECEFDIVALGEVMLRLDPGEGDTSMATREEVRALASGGSARVRR